MLALDCNFCLISFTSPGASLSTTTELEPETLENTGLSDTFSGSKENKILDACKSEEAFFIFTISSNS